MATRPPPKVVVAGHADAGALVPSQTTCRSATPDHIRRYQVDSFVARYAAVWAYGLVPDARLGEPYYQLMTDLAAAVIDAGARVLDVGCGPGRLTGSLARRLPSAEFVAVDRSASMVDLAEAILCGDRGEAVVLDPSDFGFAPVDLAGFALPNVAVGRAELAELAAGPERYDLVIASHLLDRVPDPRRSAHDLLTLVGESGRLLISCAFNYEHREQWRSLPGAAELAEVICAEGFEIDWLDDDVPYREQLDARGTWTEHRVLVLRARRTPSASTGGLRVP